MEINKWTLSTSGTSFIVYLKIPWILLRITKLPNCKKENFDNSFIFV